MAISEFLLKTIGEEGERLGLAKDKKRALIAKKKHFRPLLMFLTGRQPIFRISNGVWSRFLLIRKISAILTYLPVLCLSFKYQDQKFDRMPIFC